MVGIAAKEETGASGDYVAELVSGNVVADDRADPRADDAVKVSANRHNDECPA
jgi:hypothetical protein